MADAVPFTWDEMRMRFEPTMPTEACEICKQIPSSSRDDFPDAWKRLESAGLPEQKDSFARYRCPICHQLYTWSYQIPWSGDYDNPATDEQPYAMLYREPAYSLFHGLIRGRVADERFGRALAAIEPQLAPEIDKRNLIQLGRDFWAHHQVIRIACGEQKRWIALSDEGEVSRCTLAELARIAATDLPQRLDHPVTVLAYATFIDDVTSEYEYGCSVVERFENSQGRKEPTAAERAYIEELRLAGRIEPERVEQLADRTLVHRWVVADHKLIRRVLTVWPTGEVQREDAVVVEAIPPHSR